MHFFTFSLLRSLQRTDEALLHEQSRPAPDMLVLGWLAQRRARLTKRLRRSFASPAMTPMLFAG